MHKKMVGDAIKMERKSGAIMFGMPVLFPLKLDHESNDFGTLALGGAGYARLGTHITDLELVDYNMIPSYLHKMPKAGPLEVWVSHG